MTKRPQPEKPVKPSDVPVVPAKGSEDDQA